MDDFDTRILVDAKEEYSKELVRVLKRYILDQMAALYSILTFDLNRLLAIFTSHLWLIYNFRTLINIRKNNALKDSAIGLIYENSIAVDYFVKGKKYFYQIFD